jgi:hypothetical protein
MAALPKPRGIYDFAAQLPDFSGVFKGRELTRKERRLSSNLTPLNHLLDGGIPRGRISEITGRMSSGKTSLAASFIAAATQRGETIAVVDLEGAFDPPAMAAAGVDLNRVLWAMASQAAKSRGAALAHPLGAAWKAAELILEAGGFGLLVVDFGLCVRSIPQSSALRIARLAERSGTSVLILAPYRMCGTFAALSLALSRASTLFARPIGAAPALFDGFGIEAVVTRNKLGGSGGRIHWQTVIDLCGGDPSCSASNREPARSLG